LLKDFVKKIIFSLIQKINYIYLSKGKGFAKRCKVSHEEIEVLPKDKNLTNKRQKIANK
jgi:hypothetical protein